MPKRTYLVVTPQKNPMRFEMGGNRTDDLHAILKRRSSEGILNKAKDADFLAGLAAAFPLNYATRILEMVMQSDYVKFEVVEEEDK